MTEKWSMKGTMVGACNCDWGCPCNFDAYPSKGFCEGVYTMEVKEGRYGSIDLAGVKFTWGGKAPGAIHEGNVTSQLVLDAAMTTDQQEAIKTLWRGGGVGMPFDVFASVTTVWLDPVVAPIDIKWDGIRSEVKVGKGKIYEASISRIKNPVTGDEEEIYLDKPSGFTSLRSELGMSLVHRFSTEGLSFDDSGQYAEYAEFSYQGP